ncbi:MAG: DMT family transporter [Chloroflexota bacterium]
MVGELAALFTAALWAATGLMLKPISTRLNPFFANHVRVLASTLVYLPIVIATGGLSFLSQTPVTSILFVVGGAVVGFIIGETCFLLGIRYVPLSQVYPISLCGFPIATLIIASIFLGERLAPVALFGVVLVLAGLYLTAFPGQGILPKISLVSPEERKGLVFAVLSFVFYGISVNMTTYGIKGMNLDLANFIRFAALTVILIPITFRYWVNAPLRKAEMKTVGLAALNGAIAIGLAGRILLFSLTESGAALTSVLTSTSPLFLLPMSVFFLKEKVTRKLAAGVVISVAGICLVFVPGLLS